MVKADLPVKQNAVTQNYHIFVIESNRRNFVLQARGVRNYCFNCKPIEFHTILPTPILRRIDIWLQEITVVDNINTTKYLGIISKE
jgi:hypothetical protein